MIGKSSIIACNEKLEKRLESGICHCRRFLQLEALTGYVGVRWHNMYVGASLVSLSHVAQIRCSFSKYPLCELGRERETDTRVLTNPKNHEVRYGFHHFLNRFGLGKVRLEGRNDRCCSSGLFILSPLGGPTRADRLILLYIVIEVACQGRFNVESSIFNPPYIQNRFSCSLYCQNATGTDPQIAEARSQYNVS